MAQKDILEKKIMQRSDVFAEVFNLFVFNGRDEIRPEGLQDISPAHFRDDGRHRELIRDVLKKYQKTSAGYICFLGIENQEYLCEKMPVRNMGYDWNLYAEQVNDKKKIKVYPVYTLVLNWTEKKWNTHRNLAEMIDENIQEQLPELITQYPIHVEDMMFLEKETIMNMKTELKQICMLLKSRSDKKELDRLMQDPDYEYLSVETADLIALKLNLHLPFKENERTGGKVNMCRAWEEIKQDEFNRGAAMQKAKYEPEIAAMKADYESREKRLLEEIRELRMRLKMLDAG